YCSGLWPATGQAFKTAFYIDIMNKSALDGSCFVLQSNNNSPMKTLDAAKWIRHFLANRRNRPEPEWELPLQLAPELVRKLRPSIEQFQLGDGGGPASLIARDAQNYRNSSEEIRRIVDFWFEEEKEHSRLLGQAVKRVGGKRIESHWSFSAFCACRRIIGVRAELQILLLTELVSTAYYTVLRRHAQDGPLEATCS